MSKFPPRKVGLDPFSNSERNSFSLFFPFFWILLAPTRMSGNFWKISLMRCPDRLVPDWPLGCSQNHGSIQTNVNWKWSRSRCDSDGPRNWRWLRVINMVMRCTCRIWRSKSRQVQRWMVLMAIERANDCRRPIRLCAKEWPCRHASHTKLPSRIKCALKRLHLWR